MELLVLGAVALVLGLAGIGIGLALAPRITAWDDRRARDRDGAPGYDAGSVEGTDRDLPRPAGNDGGGGGD